MILKRNYQTIKIHWKWITCIFCSCIFIYIFTSFHDIEYQVSIWQYELYCTCRCDFLMLDFPTVIISYIKISFSLFKLLCKTNYLWLNTEYFFFSFSLNWFTYKIDIVPYFQNIQVLESVSSVISFHWK